MLVWSVSIGGDMNGHTMQGHGIVAAPTMAAARERVEKFGRENQMTNLQVTATQFPTDKEICWMQYLLPRDAFNERSI